MSEAIPICAVCRIRCRVASLLQSSVFEHCMCTASLEVQNTLCDVKDVNCMGTSFLGYCLHSMAIDRLLP